MLTGGNYISNKTVTNAKFQQFHEFKRETLSMPRVMRYSYLINAGGSDYVIITEVTRNYSFSTL